MRRFSKLPIGSRGLVILGLASGLWAQPSPFVICDEVGDQREPVVIYDDQNGVFIVAWTDGRGWPKKIYAARVDTLGNVLEEDGRFLLSPSYAPARDLILPDMAMWDTSFLLMAKNIDAGFGCGNHVAVYRKDLSRIFTRGFFTFESTDFPEAGRIAYSPLNNTVGFLIACETGGEWDIPRIWVEFLGSVGEFFLVWAHWNGPPTFYDIYGMFLDTIETVEVGTREVIAAPEKVVSVHPNPFSGETMIGVPGLEGQAQVAVYDATGRKVKSFSMVGEQKLNPGPEGVYFVDVKANGVSEIVKIVKTRR